MRVIVLVKYISPHNCCSGLNFLRQKNVKCLWGVDFCGTESITVVSFIALGVMIAWNLFLSRTVFQLHWMKIIDLIVQFKVQFKVFSRYDLLTITISQYFLSLSNP